MPIETVHNQIVSDERILTRSSIRNEPRPSRDDMLRLFSEDRRRIETDTVCSGQ
jgi:hypothetical protein